MSDEDEIPADKKSILPAVLGGVLSLGAVAKAIGFLAANGLVMLSVVIGTILSILAASILVPSWRGRRRTRAISLWAHEHGWRVDSVHMPTLRSATEVLFGVVDGISVTSCTTTYSPDWHRGLDTTRFRHVLMSSLDANFPVLTMVPTGGVRRPPSGPDDGPDLRFESALFDAGWQVRCVDARFAHDFCHPRTMERLMRPDVAGMSLLVTGGDIAVHAPGATTLAAIESRSAVLADLVRLVPPYLVADHPVHYRRMQGVRPATAVLRGAAPGETTGWPTVIMTTIVLGSVAWFVVFMALAGEVAFALGTVGVIAGVSAVPILSSRSVRRRRRNLR
ncbi:hypothetical protein SAMN05216410_3677 [Sanguibacter gelidistatuariae]|uniref:Uncharacterized protein n=1 Tax=Sanguibacter gelidistatuariae TaxID=1814289 RepID=A0A1G6WM81_9MICO|nr:hypothetical protein [Sanguibacter gelidistatuariae]SDD66773.1 hypothetical protein SAMN05216410_3677 [Sanguibacter gelidistatuariae]